MRTRQARPLPSLLLMTDERIGDALWPAITRLPRGAGIVFRHYATPFAERRALFGRVRALARRHGLILLLAGSSALATAWKADGVHGRSRHRRAAHHLLRSAPAHDRKGLNVARRAGANLVLVSPVHRTRSHPGAAALGRVRLGLMTGRRRDDIVALGGMTAHNARALTGLGVTRWAAIDGLT